jgi:hypothetical protein
MRSIFVQTIGIIHRTLATKAFRPKRALNAAVFDSVMVAVAEALCDKSPKAIATFEKKFMAQYQQLLQNDAFQIAVNKSTADEEVVRKRLELAISTIK